MNIHFIVLIRKEYTGKETHKNYDEKPRDRRNGERYLKKGITNVLTFIVLLKLSYSCI